MICGFLLLATPAPQVSADKEFASLYRGAVPVIRLLLKIPSLSAFSAAAIQSNSKTRRLRVTALNRQLTAILTQSSQLSLAAVQSTVSLIEEANARDGPARALLAKLIKIGGRPIDDETLADIIKHLSERASILTRSRFQCNVTSGANSYYSHLDATSALQRRDGKLNRQYPLLFDGRLFSIDSGYKGWGGSGMGWGISKEFDYYMKHFEKRHL